MSWRLATSSYRGSGKTQETHVVGTMWECRTHQTGRRCLAIMLRYILRIRLRRGLISSTPFPPSHIQEHPDHKYSERHNASHDTYTRSTTSIVKRASGKSRANRADHQRWPQYGSHRQNYHHPSVPESELESEPESESELESEPDSTCSAV